MVPSATFAGGHLLERTLRFPAVAPTLTTDHILRGAVTDVVHLDFHSASATTPGAAAPVFLTVDEYKYIFYNRVFIVSR